LPSITVSMLLRMRVATRTTASRSPATAVTFPPLAVMGNSQPHGGNPLLARPAEDRRTGGRLRVASAATNDTVPGTRPALFSPIHPSPSRWAHPGAGFLGGVDGDSARAAPLPTTSSTAP